MRRALLMGLLVGAAVFVLLAGPRMLELQGLTRTQTKALEYPPERDVKTGPTVVEDILIDAPSSG